MGILYLTISKVTAVGKMIAMKKCGNAAKGAKNSLKINMIRSLGCVGISLIICLFSGFEHLSELGIFFSALSGIGNALLLFSWVLCAQRCSLCTVEIFCMIGGVVLPMLSAPYMFDGESVSIFGWAGAWLLLPAAYCFFPKVERKKNFSFSALPLLILAGLSNSVCVVTQKLFTAYTEDSIADFNLITFAVCTLVLGIIFLLTKLSPTDKNIENNQEKQGIKQLIIYISIAVIMLYTSQYFNTLASGVMLSTLFYPLSYAIAMPLTLLSDIIIFKEKIKVRSIIGLLFVIGSVILISI